MDSPEFITRLQALQKEYLLELPGKISEIKSAWLAYMEESEEQAYRTLGALRQRVHALAGSGGTFGCPAISNAAEQLENQLRLALEQTEPVTPAQRVAILLEIEELEKQLHGCVNGKDRLFDPAILADVPSIRSIALVYPPGQERDKLSQELQQAHYQVSCHNTPPALLFSLGKQIPQAVLLHTGFFQQLPPRLWLEEFRQHKHQFPIYLIGERNDFGTRLATVQAGASNYFQLPLSIHQLGQTLTRHFNTVTEAPYRVLIVDDDLHLSELYRLFFEAAGITAKVAHDPLQTLEMLDDFKPDILLLDIYMPQYNGFEIATAIRQYERFDPMPIVFLTTEWHTDKKLAALDLGSDDFLTKPVEPWHLLKSVKARIRRARSVRRQESRLQLTLQELDGIWQALNHHAILSITDANGNILSINDKFCEISGYDRNELLGQNHRIVKSGFHPPEFYQQMWHTISQGQVWHGTIQNRNKSGTPYWIETTILPLLDESGRPQEYISIRTEITLHQKTAAALQLSEERLRLSQLHANIGTWDWNIETGELYWSDRIAPLMTGQQGSMLPSREQFLQAIHPDDRERFEKAISKTLEQNTTLDIAHRVRWHNGDIHWIHQRGILLQDPLEQTQHLLCVAQDITQQRTLLEQHARDQAQLIRARDAAEAANQAKSDFLSSMSHELRTPLNAILGFAQLLESDPDYPLPAELLDYTQHILKAGWHLLDIVNDVLDLARIEAGKINLTLENINPIQALDDSIRLLSPLASQRGIQLFRQIDTELTPAPILADPTRFRQIILNLLSNAIKYNQPNGSVWLRLKPVNSEFIRLEVEDTGMGFSQRELAHLFEPFNRLGAEGSDIEGSGIGLTITKRVIELMGGAISVSSEYGKGSTFRVDLRIAQQEEKTPLPAPLMPSNDALSAQQFKLLLIEDNAANTYLVETALRRHSGIVLYSAQDAETGLLLAQQEMPDLVLADIHLPGMDGFGLLEKLQQNPATRTIPVIAISANAMPSAIQKGLSAGFRHYLTKPLMLDDFVNVIHTTLQPANASNQTVSAEMDVDDSHIPQAN